MTCSRFGDRTNFGPLIRSRLATGKIRDRQGSLGGSLQRLGNLRAGASRESIPARPLPRERNTMLPD
jgi:hypothetical protein